MMSQAPGLMGAMDIEHDGVMPEVSLRLRLLDRVQELHDAWVERSPCGDVMCLGFESVLTMARLILGRRDKIRRAIDFGTGFSSAMLRVLLPKSTWIESVDTSPQWMVDAINFCHDHKIRTSGFKAWDTWKKDPPVEYDFVLWDIGKPVDRVMGLKHIMGQVAPGGVLWVDDMHRAEYNRQVYDMIERDGGWVAESLEHCTTDRHGRWGARFDKIARCVK